MQALPRNGIMSVMETENAEMEGLKIVEPQVFGDSCGWFVDDEWWCPIYEKKYAGQRLGKGI